MLVSSILILGICKNTIHLGAVLSSLLMHYIVIGPYSLLSRECSPFTASTRLTLVLV